MIMSARDEGMFPGWRVHLLSAWLGTVCFVVALFCLEALVQESKIVAFRSTIRWYPFVVLTGIANIFNIHTLIVIAVAAAYAIWMWRRGKCIFPDKAMKDYLFAFRVAETLEHEPLQEILFESVSLTAKEGILLLSP